MNPLLRWCLAALVLSFAAAGSARAQTTYALTSNDRGTWIKGFYPLYEALAQRNVGEVKRLTPRGKGINSFGEAGATPLSWLLTTFRNTPAELQILEHLLENGADPNQPDAQLEDGTPQRAGTHLYAGRNASSEATRLLLDHGMTFDTPEAEEAFVEAAAKGNLGFLRTAAAMGHLTPDRLARLPLLAVAALQGQYLAAGFLLERGAAPDSVRLDGFLPLHWAVLRNQPGVVRLLLDAGADPALRTRYRDNPDFDGLTALELIDVLRAQDGAGPDDPYLSEIRALLEQAAATAKD